MGFFWTLQEFNNLISKKNLISTLVHRALSICPKSLLHQELEKIRVILRDNGYPESIINRKISTNWLGFNLLQNLARTNVLCISNCPE